MVAMVMVKHGCTKNHASDQDKDDKDCLGSSLTLAPPPQPPHSQETTHTYLPLIDPLTKSASRSQPPRLCCDQASNCHSRVLRTSSLARTNVDVVRYSSIYRTQSYTD